jgi:hypothetical protein
MDSFTINHSCDTCIHSEVCQYKTYFNDIASQIEGKVDNVCMPEIFKVNMECTAWAMKYSVLAKDWDAKGILTTTGLYTGDSLYTVNPVTTLCDTSKGEPKPHEKNL